MYNNIIKKMIAVLSMLILATCLFTACGTPSDQTEHSFDDTVLSGPLNPSGTTSVTINTEPKAEDPAEWITEGPTEGAAEVASPTTAPTEAEPTETTHTHNYARTMVAPSCTKQGYSVYTCSCGDSYKTDYADATGHTEVVDSAVAATCEKSGLSKGSHCSICGEILKRQTTVAATGHSWLGWKITTEAQIGIPGKEERKCSSCQKVESRAIDALPEPTYQTFDHEIGVYEYDNVRYEMALANHFDYAAYITIYATSKDSVHETSIITAFTDHFGFSPTAKVKVETIGTYLVDDQVKTVYQYCIFDKTHPFLDHAPYEVYHQICTDGVSHWVGFAILGSNDDDWDELMSEPTVRNLKKEMYRMFYEKTGYSADYIAQHKEDFCMGWISVAGEMRTADGKVVEVLYIFCREKEK